jgi:peptidoglycan hydrolase-like protein with peptidoglycan-binding domain
MENDGGQGVHALHVALEAAGYYPGEDDVRWWTFGSETLAAVKTAQACNGLPESGVSCAATWRLLLGEGATPGDLATLRSGNSDDEDLEFQGDRVWLIGEQRWENRRRTEL